ncbi:hypothetical protein IC575_004693 [Cucumis melo]
MTSKNMNKKRSASATEQYLGGVRGRRKCEYESSGRKKRYSSCFDQTSLLLCHGRLTT